MRGRWNDRESPRRQLSCGMGSSVPHTEGDAVVAMNANDRRAPPAPGAPTPPCSQCLHPTVPVPNRENAYRCETPGCPSEGNYFVPVPALPPEIVTALDEYGLAVAQATLAMREPAGQIERAKLLAAITRLTGGEV